MHLWLKIKVFSAGDKLKSLALKMNAFYAKDELVQNAHHYTLHMIGTVLVYIQAKAFSAGQNST